MARHQMCFSFPLRAGIYCRKTCQMKILFPVLFLVLVDVLKCIFGPAACVFAFLTLWMPHIVSRLSKPYNSDFYQNNFLSTLEYQTHGAHSVKFS